MLDSDYQRHVPPHVRAAMDRLRDPQRVWDIFRDDETVLQMERLTARKRPAVGAASARLLALGDWVRGDDAKKTFGKIARCIMESRGYIIESKGVKTPEDQLFSRGTRYRNREPAPRHAGLATLTLHDIDPDVLACLRTRSEKHGRSIEAEALALLSKAVAADRRKAEPDLAEAIHRRFAALGGLDDLPEHPPVPTEPPPELER